MIKYLPKHERECPSCHNEMDFSHITYRFKGNQDELYECPNCGYALLVLVRFGEIWKKEHVVIKSKRK